MTMEYGDVPRYQQLAGILRQQIESGELAPRTPIPSKRQLRQQYWISGQTVDRAVQLLREEGKIRTVPGLGLFVRPREEWGEPR
jgi:DNA-binding GntR family transcriptional regulator